MTPARKKRLDELLVERALAPSPAAAAGLILAGRVDVDGRRVTKAGAPVTAAAAVAVRPGKPFASRGGVKLAFALEHFNVNVAGRTCLDVGAATGGFTSALLARGAAHVHALDVGRGLLAWELRHDARVSVWERRNVRAFDGAGLEPAPTLVVVDVSFIGLAAVLPPLLGALPAATELVALVKPQFEAPRGRLAPGGVVRDAAVQQECVRRVAALCGELGFAVVGAVASPLRGPAGNQEYFVHGVKGATPAEPTTLLATFGG
jgi:23S rRNA (cytidine1920-2'-O)/16S rRNA (cytidine1409-2'-O)-methyltransferase